MGLTYGRSLGHGTLWTRLVASRRHPQSPSSPIENVAVLCRTITKRHAGRKSSCWVLVQKDTDDAPIPAFRWHRLENGRREERTRTRDHFDRLSHGMLSIGVS